MTEQNLTKLTINTLTKSQYQALYNSGDISYTEIYLITDDNGTGVYALANNVYTKAEIDDIIANLPSGGGSGSGVDLSNYYTKDEITALLANKANTSDLSDYVELADLANVATSGDYNDLSNTPTIPSKTSDLTNDSGYVSSSSLSTVATSGSYNDLSNKPDLTVYETKAEAFSGDYNDLTNKPDLSVYQTVANSFSGDYDDLSNKPDLSVYQTIANAFSGSYNDLTDKPTIPTIPTNISSFTNDSGYQTASNVNTAIATALTGYATESYVQTAVANLGSVFTIKGSVSTVANLPSTNNSIGDVYYVAEKQAGYIWIEIDNAAQWEELGETIDLSNYVQTSDLTWNNISSKPTFSTVATSGSYADLSNKPTIPDAVSGTNDGTNWTSLTIGSDTYSLASGSGSSYSAGTWINIDSNNNINVSNPYISLVDGSGNPRVMISSTSNGTAPTFTATYCNISPTGFGIVDKTQGYGFWAGHSAAYTYYRHRNILVNNQWTLSFPTASGTIATQEWVSNNFSSSGSGGGTSVSGTNDGTNWTSLTIGNDTYGLASGTSVSGTNDGSNWTSLTIGNTTYNIPSGGSSSGSSADAVDLTSNQDITGVKTFVGKQKLKFKQTGSNDILGFTAYDYNNTEIGNLQVANRTVGGSSYTYVTLGNWSSQSAKSKVGFRLQPNNSSNSYNFVMPYGAYSDFNANTYATNADITIPCAFTDGTTTVKANASGLVDLSSLNLGGGSSTSGSSVSGTNDGTNWTSLTINGSTYNIPAGGSSSGGGSSAGTGAIYYHNVRLFFGTSDAANYTKVIEFSMLTKSATQILTMNELISQVSALQNEPYNDSVVGVIFGQVYQNNNRSAKEQILGFGLTGTSSNPDFYAAVRNNSGRTSYVSISATNSTSFTQTIQWIDNLQNLIGYERTNNCYDIVTGGASSSSGSGIVDINDIPLVERELAVKQVPLYDEQTGEPLVDGNGDPITEEQLGLSDDFIYYVDTLKDRIYTLEQNSGGNVPTKTSDLINDSGFVTSSALTNYVTTDTAQEITGVKTFVGNTLAFKCDTNNASGFKIYNQDDTEIGSLKVDNRGIGHIALSNASPSLVKSYIGFRVQPNGSSNNYNFVMPYTYNTDFQSAGYSTIGETVFPFVFTDGTTNVKANGTGVVDLSSLNLGGSSYTAGTGIDITNDAISVDSTVVALKSDIPTVPTNISSFTNDSGYITGITSSDVTTALGYTPGTSNFSGNYNDLTNKPTIPDAVSGTNDGTNWTSLTIGSDTYGIPSGGGSAGPTITRYTGYASYPITYSVPSDQSQYSYMYIGIYSSELSGFLNYDNVNPGDIIYINTTLGYTASDRNYYRSGNLFTVCVPPKPDSTYPVYTTAGSENSSVSGSWGCTTINRMTNTQQTIASNIVKRTVNGQDTTNNFYIRVPLLSYSNITIKVTINSITHIAF